ncbi:MAG: hypothetical protein CME61_04710 [Halobacteriovoraceae bacterium]|nr:hypothetical protein [Halobacteriovoraceae bacterium]
MKFLLFALSLTTALPTFSKQNPVVATVNENKIYLSELEKNVVGAKYFVTNKKVTKAYVLDELINRELGIIKAKKSKLANDPVVQSKINDILYHAQISKDLEGEFSNIKITDEDIKSYYKKFPEYRTAHILLRYKVNPEPNELLAAAKVSSEIYKKLKKDPSKFAALANEYSQSPNAEVGGDVGFQPAVNLTPEYFEAINGKSIGHITEPVSTQYGLQIIKVLGKKDFKEINKTIYQKFVYDQKRDKIISTYFKKLRQNASIKIEKKYLK